MIPVEIARDSRSMPKTPPIRRIPLADKPGRRRYDSATRSTMGRSAHGGALGPGRPVRDIVHPNRSDIAAWIESQPPSLGQAPDPYPRTFRPRSTSNTARRHDGEWNASDDE
jgi:hypothetical protein